MKILLVVALIIGVASCTIEDPSKKENEATSEPELTVVKKGVVESGREIFNDARKSTSRIERDERAQEFITEMYGTEQSIPEILDGIQADSKTPSSTKKIIEYVKGLWTKENIIGTLKQLAFGQLLSILNASTSVINSLATITVPTVQNSCVYAIILIFSAALNRQYLIRFFKHALRNRKSAAMYLTKSIFMGIADVSANDLIVAAFQSTSILNATLISSLSLVFVIIFGSIIFQSQYFLNHFFAGALGLAAFGTILYTKVNGLDETGRGITGDLYAGGAAIGYAISNVFNENISVMESGYPLGAVFAMGSVGSLLSIISLLTPLGQTDIANVQALLSEPLVPVNGGLIAYPFILSIFYVLAPAYLQHYSAISFNLNLATSDLYVYIYNKYKSDYQLSPLYEGAVAMVFLAIIIYNLKDSVMKAEIDKFDEPLNMAIRGFFDKHLKEEPATATVPLEEIVNSGDVFETVI